MSELSKAAIVRACIQKQEGLIKDFEKEVASIKSEILDNDTSQSQGDNSRAERTDVLNSYEKELAFLKDELLYLENLDWKGKNEEAEPGAVVATDKLTFFICVSIEDVMVASEKVYGISAKAPIFGAMRGKKTGDSFEYNNVKYSIKNIY